MNDLAMIRNISSGGLGTLALHEKGTAMATANTQEQNLDMSLSHAANASQIINTFAHNQIRSSAGTSQKNQHPAFSVRPELSFAGNSSNSRFPVTKETLQ